MITLIYHNDLHCVDVPLKHTPKQLHDTCAPCAHYLLMTEFTIAHSSQVMLRVSQNKDLNNERLLNNQKVRPPVGK